MLRGALAFVTASGLWCDGFQIAVDRCLVVMKGRVDPRGSVVDDQCLRRGDVAEDWVERSFAAEKT
jgi:hypothetical protein